MECPRERQMVECAAFHAEGLRRPSLAAAWRWWERPRYPDAGVSRRRGHSLRRRRRSSGPGIEPRPEEGTARDARLLEVLGGGVSSDLVDADTPAFVALLLIF